MNIAFRHHSDDLNPLVFVFPYSTLSLSQVFMKFNNNEILLRFMMCNAVLFMKNNKKRYTKSKILYNNRCFLVTQNQELI